MWDTSKCVVENHMNLSTTIIIVVPAKRNLNSYHSLLALPQAINRSEHIISFISWPASHLKVDNYSAESMLKCHKCKSSSLWHPVHSFAKRDPKGRLAGTCGLLWHHTSCNSCQKCLALCTVCNMKSFCATSSMLNDDVQVQRSMKLTWLSSAISDNICHRTAWRDRHCCLYI